MVSTLTVLRKWGGRSVYTKQGFKGVDPHARGRPAYHPAVLLKIYLYGYLTASNPAADWNVRHSGMLNSGVA